MPTPDNCRFAKQAGAIHIVADWVDYVREGSRIPTAESAGVGWGNTQNQDHLRTVETPIPTGQVWNMTYDPDAPPGNAGMVTSEQLWQRLGDLVSALVPVAEEAGVRLARARGRDRPGGERGRAVVPTIAERRARHPDGSCMGRRRPD